MKGFKEHVKKIVADQRGCDVVEFGASHGVKDGTSKWLIRDTRDNPNAVALCSSLAAPELVKRNVEKQRTHASFWERHMEK